MRKRTLANNAQPKLSSLAYLWIIGILVLVSQSISGQNYLYDGNQTSTYYEHGYEIEHINNQEMLCHDIGHVFKDDKGLLWFIEVESIKSYDGTTVKLYEADASVMTNGYTDQFHNMLWDKKGDLWLTSMGAGIVHYGRQSQKYQRFKSNIATASMAEDKFGVKWITTAEGVMKAQNKDTVTITKQALQTIGQALQANISTLISEEKLISAFTKVKDNTSLSTNFSLKEDTELLIVGQGELKNLLFGEVTMKYVDFGWIEDATKDTIWRMTPSKSCYAGGALYNRMNVEFLSLPKGSWIGSIVPRKRRQLSIYRCGKLGTE